LTQAKLFFSPFPPPMCSREFGYQIAPKLNHNRCFFFFFCLFFFVLFCLFLLPPDSYSSCGTKVSPTFFPMQWHLLFFPFPTCILYGSNPLLMHIPPPPPTFLRCISRHKTPFLGLMSDPSSHSLSIGIFPLLFVYSPWPSLW